MWIEIYNDNDHDDVLLGVVSYENDTSNKKTIICMIYTKFVYMEYTK